MVEIASRGDDGAVSAESIRGITIAGSLWAVNPTKATVLVHCDVIAFDNDGNGPFVLHCEHLGWAITYVGEGVGKGSALRFNTLTEAMAAAMIASQAPLSALADSLGVIWERGEGAHDFWVLKDEGALMAFTLAALGLNQGGEQ